MAETLLTIRPSTEETIKAQDERAAEQRQRSAKVLGTKAEELHYLLGLDTPEARAQLLVKQEVEQITA